MPRSHAGAAPAAMPGSHKAARRLGMRCDRGGCRGPARAARLVGVAGGLDRVRGVEALVRKRHGQEVALHGLAQRGQAELRARARCGCVRRARGEGACPSRPQGAGRPMWLVQLGLQPARGKTLMHSVTGCTSTTLQLLQLRAGWLKLYILATFARQTMFDMGIKPLRIRCPGLDRGRRGAARRSVVVVRALDLVAVDGEPGDLRAAGGRDRAHWPAHAAADVQARGPGAQAQQRGQARLVRGLARGPVLAGQARREVEALAPAPLVQVGHQVVCARAAGL